MKKSHKIYNFRVKVAPKSSVKKCMHATDDGNNCRSNGGRGQTSSQ
jgi:hypothetical protein